MDDRRTEMIEMRKRLDKIESDLKEILEIIQLARGFFQVAGAIGTGIKWIAGVVAAVIALWATLHHTPKG